MQRVSRSDDTTGAFRIADNASTTNRFDHFFLALRQPSPLFCPDGGLSMSIINLFIKKSVYKKDADDFWRLVVLNSLPATGSWLRIGQLR